MLTITVFIISDDSVRKIICHSLRVANKSVMHGTVCFRQDEKIQLYSGKVLRATPNILERGTPASVVEGGLIHFLPHSKRFHHVQQQEETQSFANAHLVHKTLIGTSRCDHRRPYVPPHTAIHHWP